MPAQSRCGHRVSSGPRASCSGIAAASSGLDVLATFQQVGPATFVASLFSWVVLAMFAISLKAGGSGLLLTEAGYVFLLDPGGTRGPRNRASTAPT